MFKNTFFSAILLVLACSNAPATERTSPASLPIAATPPTTATAQAVPSTDLSATAILPQKADKQHAQPHQPTKTGSTAAQKPIVVQEQSGSAAPLAAPAAATHATWDSLLQKYVSETGKVNYKGLKADPAALEAYCRSLAENTPQESWSREEKLAYWINTYNAFTMKLIVDNYPTASILRFDGGKTWDVKRITLGGKKYSLNQIENEIIRPQFKEPRIHFAINCAAKSCPPLFNHAYTAANLEATLESRAKQFINNSAYNTITAGKATVSKIFDWYGADFGNLREYLNRYVDTPLKPTATVLFKEYDWDLNE